MILSVMSTLLLSLLVYHYTTQDSANSLKTRFDFVNSPNSLKIFTLNFIFHHLNSDMVYKEKELSSKLVDFVNPPDPSFDLYFVPRRKHYCQANFLYSTLNFVNRPDPSNIHTKQRQQYSTLNFENQYLFNSYLFMDINNRNELKKELSPYFDFLNTSIYKNKEPTKKDIEKLKNMEWNPKIKLFFSSANFNYQNEIGRTSTCMMQMSNHVPGTAYLSRADLLADSLVDYKLKKRDYPCFKINTFYPKTFRLYDKEECEKFFNVIKTKNFKKKMRQENVYVWKNVESHSEHVIDYIEIVKLNRIYKRGADCGKLKKKNIIQSYIKKQLMYKNGRKFKLRVFLNIISTDPLVILFNKGYVLLDRYNNSISFYKAMLTHERFMAYMTENKVMDEYEFNQVMNKIKKISAKLNFIVKDRYLRDPRFFQTIALDFVVDQELNPYLVDVKGSPEFTSKNLNYVRRSLELQTEIVNRRAWKIMYFVSRVKHDIFGLINSEEAPMHYLEDFIEYLHANFDFKKIRKEFRQINKNELDGLLKHDDFDILYDGTTNKIVILDFGIASQIPKEKQNIFCLLLIST